MIYAREIVPAALPATQVGQHSRDGVGYHLEEQFWGYRVVPNGRASLGLIAVQVTAMICSAAFLAAALMLGVMSPMSGLLLRLPLIFVALGLGFALMWFASRGNHIQIEVDTTNGEVREIVRNRTGATTVVTRHGFDSIGNVFIARSGNTAPVLTLRCRHSARHMTVAVGTEDDLASLRDRMGRDMILSRAVA